MLMQRLSVDRPCNVLLPFKFRALIGAVICLLLLVAVAFAQRDTSEEEKSYGRPNGVFWLQRDRQARVDLLYGIEQGIGLLEDEKAISPQLVDSYTIRGFRFGDLADQVDKLYEDKANLRIPIAYAYLYAIRKARGDSVGKLEEFLSTQRSRFLLK